MQKRYAFVPVAAVVAVLGLACTEPNNVPYFEGTITSVFQVKDIYTQPNASLDIEVVRSADDPCQQANVHVLDGASIYATDAPTVKLTRESLAVGQVVRVSPLPAIDPCPIPIDAESIVIVR